ncbi:hypothetical protein FA592_02975 [Sulfurospirillum diekertiae]|uniref:Uncharacterized protein n=1 Tax=Sulfurospirillum diekertiae TaxID=1854492 RepID=A0A6G9VQS0_9BACT|nr:hypothetical protein [Sulfurospirillum diekertiae]QIR75245.1 hypothetical protein FA584_03075 [Sulfurospirillum diekertiae]QIR77896.1 hypothetical protein FA592_02975 [Sulfurospirillum diekertiae]
MRQWINFSLVHLTYKIKLYYALHKVFYTLLVLMIYQLLVQESILTLKNGIAICVTLILSMLCEHYYKRYLAQYYEARAQNNDA